LVGEKLKKERIPSEHVMIRYLLLIIFIITLISLLALFEKPSVNQYHPIQVGELESEKAEPLEDVEQTRQMIYLQNDMDFLMDAYGVGGS
jgi:hypothetical protein